MFGIKGTLGVLVGMTLATATVAQAQAANPMGRSTNTIVDVAIKAGSFKTLLTAIPAAGLTETLRGEGPFTVFAPTDEAFAKLPSGTLEALLANPAKLRAILTYHVVPGRVMATQVVEMHSATTVNGQDVRIRVDGGKVYVDAAQVIATDFAASNGVIHVIDTVILPRDS